MTDLQARLLAAHAADDRTALIALYTEAADQAGGIDAACFFLTHAYIYALERGDARTDTLFCRLAEHGRV